MSTFNAPRPKASVIDAVEGFYLAHTLNHFHSAGLFCHLSDGATVDELSTRFDYAPDLVHALLEFLVQRSDVVTRSQARYRLAEPYADNDYFLGFQLDKFIGSYGPAIAELERSLRLTDRGRSLVNRAVESQAYDRIGSPPNPVVLAVISELGSVAMLDLGCGPGTTLTVLAERDPGFRGWGIDVTESMCEVARARVRRLGLADRIEIICDDARDLEVSLPTSARDKIEVLHCKGLMNELFGQGDRNAVAYLKKLRDHFPGCLLLNVDYYGKLGWVDPIPSEYRHTIVHDVIQVLTGQGVPPASKEGWAAVYEAAGAELEHAFEGDDSGIEWCVHAVRL